MLAQTLNLLFENALNEVYRACLLVASCKESGVWLSALPISSLGLKLDDNVVRITLGGLCLATAHSLSSLWCTGG